MIIEPQRTLMDGGIQTMLYNPTALARRVAGERFSRYNGGWIRRVTSVDLSGSTNEFSLQGDYLPDEAMTWLPPGVYLDCSIGGTRTAPKKNYTLFTLLSDGVVPDDSVVQVVGSGPWAPRLWNPAQRGLDLVAQLSDMPYTVTLLSATSSHKSCYVCRRAVAFEQARAVGHALATIAALLTDDQGAERALGVYQVEGPTDTFLDGAPVLCAQHSREFLERALALPKHTVRITQPECLELVRSHYRDRHQRKIIPALLAVRFELFTVVDTLLNTSTLQLVDDTTGLQPDGKDFTEFYCDLCGAEVTL